MARTNGTSGVPVDSDEPSFVLMAHDKLTPITLRTYIEWYAVQPQSDGTVVKALLAHLEAITEWQKLNAGKVRMASVDWLKT